MEKFIEPILIKAGSNLIKLGWFGRAPIVDCRVISEDQYQKLLKASGILNPRNAHIQIKGNVIIVEDGDGYN